MNKNMLVGVSTVLGILFLILAAMYFVTPARALPSFIPGHEASSMTKHIKHGIGSGILGLACFAFAWFQSGKKSK